MEKLAGIIKSDLSELCDSIGERTVGSRGNKKAVEYVERRFRQLGLEVQTPEFSCLDWEDNGCLLRLGETEIEAFASPYSKPCDLEAPFRTICSINELQNSSLSGKIAVLHGDICKEQLMPKSFVFYNPVEHQQIIRLLEEKEPLAVVAVTARNPELAGALYPFPLIEDGDFHIPSVHLRDTEGEKIFAEAGKKMKLQVHTRRISSSGSNVIALRKGRKPEKIVFSAHVDTKKGTCGALDNAAGVVTLVALAELLAEYEGLFTYEWAVLNGEDYYSQPGQMLYLSRNDTVMDSIILNINIDGAGHRGFKSTFCMFGLDPGKEEIATRVLSESPEFSDIEPWYQGDHMMFVSRGVPAIAITSGNLQQIANEVAHTRYDTLSRLEPGKLANVAAVLSELVTCLEK